METLKRKMKESLSRELSRNENLEAMNKRMVSLFEFFGENFVNEYLDSHDFTGDTDVAWTHGFESTKRIVKKFTPNSSSHFVTFQTS